VPCYDYIASAAYLYDQRHKLHTIRRAAIELASSPINLLIVSIKLSRKDSSTLGLKIVASVAFGANVTGRHSPSGLPSGVKLPDFPVVQAFSAPSGVCVRANGRSPVDQASNPQHPGPAVPFFSAADGPVLPLSFSLGQFQRHAHDGGARNRRMAARMARTIGPVTATSASWKVMARA
jgi:hypothetical protein